MYIAKVNDRGKAFHAYMFDEQLFDLDDLFNKSYYMKKSSDRQEIIDYCNKWNETHKETIRKNDTVYYLNVALKGLLQAPALVILYSCIIMGVVLLFGSELFYDQVQMYGIAAFGNIRTAVIITYVISAGIGLLISLSTYNNVFYKLIRSLFSVLCFIAVSPVFFDKVFFANSNAIITVTIIFVVGCVFVRTIIDRLLTNIVRGNTEKIIRTAHMSVKEVNDPGIGTETVECKEANITAVQFEPVIRKIRNGAVLKQYK